MEYLEKPGVNAISKVSIILRIISLPFLFHTVHLNAKYTDTPGLRHLAKAYVHNQALCKHITELRLDYSRIFVNSSRGIRSTVGISQTDADLFREINRSPLSCLTTLVLRDVTLVDVWIHSILNSQTLRRLHLHECWCNEWTMPLPSTKISELVLQNSSDSLELGMLAVFLAPQLEVLELHSMSSSTIFPETCTRLRKYVFRLPEERNGYSIGHLREFLIHTTTIEELELGVVLPSYTLPLPPSALPNLRLYDITLSDGMAATKFITGPRRKLGTLHIRDDLLVSHDLHSVQNFLDLPYEVSELRLTFRRHIIEELLPAQMDRGLPDVEALHLNIRANHLCLLPWGDLGLCRNCTVLDSALIDLSEFVDRVKAAPLQEEDSDCSKSPCLQKLKKIDVDIDMDSIGTTSPHALDEWFRCVVAANCPVLEEVYLRIWKANDRGVEENRAELERRFWARWHLGIDEHWHYKWGFHLGI